MDPRKSELEKKRRAALDRLRGNRGTPRHGEDRTRRFDQLAEYLDPFLRLSETMERPGADRVKVVLEAMKKARGKEPGEDAPADEANWQQLMQEIGLNNFKDSVQRWLGSVPLEFGENSTPIEDLEGLLREARLRLRLLTTLLDFAQQEVDDIEVSIRASRVRTATAQ